MRRGRAGTVVLAAVALALVGGGGWQVWQRVDRPTAAADAPATPCASPVAVRVVTSTAMRPPLEALTRSLPAACATFTVVAEPASTTARRLETGGGGAVVWVSDSAPLARQVAAASPGTTVSAPVAWTPMVLAVPPGASAPTSVTWATALVSPNGRVPDPKTSTVGSLALMEGLGEIDTYPAAQRSAAFATIGGMLSRVVPEESLLTTHAGQSDSAIFPTTEQQVQQAAVDGLTVRRATSTTPALEYSVVATPTAPAGPVKALTAALTSAAGQKALRAAGFRTPADPSPVVTGAPPAAAMAAAPSEAQARAADQAWAAIARPTRLLNVIDTSGSMRAPAGGGSSRIAVATTASRGANQLLADHNSVGLWTFSTRQNGNRDWTEVQPLRPLGEDDQRSKLAFALGSLPTRLGGDTGLYDTLDAAYATMLRGYDADAVNLIVLFTDGVNDDTSGGLSLAALRADLAKRADRAKPVTVLLIGMGGVDAKALAPVAAAVPRVGGGGAAVFTIDRPQDISGVYVTMLLRRLPQG